LTSFFLPFSLSLLLPPPQPTLFPYTTLFRSLEREVRLEQCFGLRGQGQCQKSARRGGNRPVKAASGSERLVQSRPGETKHLAMRSEEHTSELQSPDHLVCRLLLEKKKTKKKY